MIFITQTDIFGHGLSIYTINRYFEEIDDVFDDGSHIVYVNGSYRGDDATGKLMHDFACKNSKDIFYPELAKGVKHFFKEEGGRKVMCEVVEKYAKSYAEQYVGRKAAEERNIMTQIVAALVAGKDNDVTIKELNCSLEQIIPLRTVMSK